MNLLDCDVGKVYIIKSINGGEEMNAFLLSLGCFEGEEIQISKRVKSNLIVSIKGSKYAIDNDLACEIEICS